MNAKELQRILLMPEGLRATYLAALKKPQKMADGGGFGRKAQRINQATSFGDEPMGNQIVKDVGGNWLGGNVEKALDPLTRKPRTAGINQHTEQDTARDEAANNWVRGNLTNYVKKQMGTEADPVRKLAEEGVVHIPSEQVGINRYRAPQKRKELGMPQLGQSEAAKAWEDASDAAIDVRKLSGLHSGFHEPWMEKAPADTKIANASDLSGLGFDHIMDVLKEDLAEGRIRPEQLSKISMEQAVRRVHEYDQDKLKKMRETAIKNTEGMPVHKVYDDGHKWIELAMPKGEAALSDLGKQIMAKHKAEGTEPSPGVLEQAIKQGGEEKLSDALKYEGDTMGHCVGGYCPDVAEGRSRIFSLRDAKGEPHVTIETQPGRGVGPKAFFMNDLAPKSLQNAIFEMEREGSFNDPHALEDFIEQSPEYKQYVKSLPPKIEQIKGKGNARPHTKYDKYTQDFVKAGTWDEVDDLNHTGLIHLDPKSDLAKTIQATGEKPPRYITNQDLTDLSKKHNYPGWVNSVQKKADGGSMKAPERDANLAQFLKDSAVKDRMYHATHSDFNAFRNNHRGIHFLTPRPKFANDFLTNSGQDEHEEGANIMPVHVNAKNPFDYRNKQHVNALGVKASIGKLGLDEIKKGKWSRIEDRTTLKAIKDLGHDGVYVNENGVKNLGVFYPHQVKSAIGNRGTYDVNDPDITKAQGGSIKPVGYTKEKVTVSPSLDRMQYELMSMKHFKKAK